MNVNEEVGRRIYARRRRMGLRLKDVASRMGVRFQCVQKYESGATALTVTRLVQIAEALGVPPAELLPPGAS